MALLSLIDGNELFMWERVGFCVFLLCSLYFDNYQKYLLIVAVVTFVIIYCLYLYNFLRDAVEGDCNKLKTTKESNDCIKVLKQRLREEESNRKEAETKFNEKLRVFEKKIEETSRIYDEKCAKLEEDKRNLAHELENQEHFLSGLLKFSLIAKQIRIVEEKIVETDKIYQEKCAKLEEDKRNLAYDLEKVRHETSVSDEIIALKRIDSSKDEIEAIRKTSEEKFKTWEKEKHDLMNELNNERVTVMEFENKYGTSREECDKLKFEIEGKQTKVLELEKYAEELEKTCNKQTSKLADQRLKVSELEYKCTSLEEVNNNLDVALEVEREKVLQLENHCALEYHLEEERFKVWELKQECMRLEDEIEVEREKVSILENHCALETHLVDERLKVCELEEKCTRLDEELSSIWKELDEERGKVSELEQKCARLEDDKGNLQNELEVERRGNELSRFACEQLRGVSEALKKTLLEKSKEDENKKTLEWYNMKIFELGEKCFNLEMEKKIGEAERDNMLALLDNQTSVVEAYKDMLDKEECLMKLFGENGKFRTIDG